MQIGRAERLFSNFKARYLSITLLAWVASIFFMSISPGQFLELKGLDSLFFLRGYTAPPENIIIVALDEPSFQEIGLQWPWPRSLHARLIRTLKEAGAKVIGLDILFVEPSVSQEDQALAEAIAEADNSVLASDISVIHDPSFVQEMLIEPLPLLKGAGAASGVVTLIPDSDQCIRHNSLTFGENPSFALEIVRLYLARGNIQLSPSLTPTEGLINYTGPARHIKTVSYYQALTYKESLPPDCFRDKIVLVGRSLKSSPDPQKPSPDFFSTPFSLMAGVEIHANIIQTILEGRSIISLSNAVKTLFLLGIALLGTGLLIRFRPLLGLIITFSLAILYTGVSYWFFTSQLLWLPTIVPLFELGFICGVNILGSYAISEREKARIRKAFKYYVPAQIVEEIIKDPKRLELGGEKIDATILFADIAGFTTLSERLSPEKLVSLLNGVLSALTEVVFNYEGTVDKYIGDEIMALWNAPLRQEDHFTKACLAALEMQKQMAILTLEDIEAPVLPLKVKIGIHTGPVIAGNLGSYSRFNYTVVGDSVNLASRLQGVNKVFNTHTILSEATYILVKELFAVRELDTLKVVGKTEPVKIYELLAVKEDITDIQKAMLMSYQEGLSAYKNRCWEMALQAFKEGLKVMPDDGPAQVYLARCQTYLQSPPPLEWDGVFQLEYK